MGHEDVRTGGDNRNLATWDSGSSNWENTQIKFLRISLFPGSLAILAVISKTGTTLTVEELAKFVNNRTYRVTGFTSSVAGILAAP